MKIPFYTWFLRLPEKINNEKLKANFKQAFPYWIASLITGLVAVLYTKLFGWAEMLSGFILSKQPWLIFIITPISFVSAWWLVKKYARNARGSGIPAVMASLELATPLKNHLVNKLLSIRIILVKIFSTLLMVLGGGAIGREGPTVQIAASIFRKVNQLIPESWPKISKKNMILTGAAAGLAAAFNTPLGGIVFAVEELAKTHISNFKTAIFTAVIIAGLTAQYILGSYLYIGYPDVNGLSGYIFLFVAIVAVIAGFMGAAMSRMIIKIMRWKRTIKMKGFELMYVLFCAMLMALIAYSGLHSILYSGKAEMTNLLFNANKYGGWKLPVLRIVGPIASFSTGAAGGVFAPALSAGAAIGSLVSEWFSLASANANLLILAGMVAFLTGVTRSPFTSAILVLEMTNSHNIIFHLMLSGLIAGMVAMTVDKRSFYEHLKDQYLHEVQLEAV